MGDTGLLISHAFSESELNNNELYKQILNGKLSINEGMIYENAVSQCLTSLGYKLYFYVHFNQNKHRNDIEIDFIISNKSKVNYKIFPIEVKSGAKYSITSLENFSKKFADRIGKSYVIHPRNLSIKDKITSIPPYMIFCLKPE